MEYRLAPEVMFPGDKEDVYDVVSYLCGHPDEYPVDVNRMIIGGHSAGANISTAVCLMAKETGDFRFLAQILDYPPLDLFYSGRAEVFIRRRHSPSDSGSF